MSELWGNLDLYGILSVSQNTSGGYSFPAYAGENGQFLGVVNGGKVVFARPGPTMNVTELSGGQDLSDNVDFLLTQISGISGQIDTFEELLDTPAPGVADSSEGEIVIVDLNASSSAQKIAFSGVLLSDLQADITQNQNDITILYSQVSSLSGAASDFLSLTDTPSSYTGQSGQAVIVNGSEDGLEFGPAGDATLRAEVEALSGSLQTQVNTNSSSINVLQSETQYLSGAIDSITVPTSADFADEFVNVTGDTMTGLLTLKDATASDGTTQVLSIDGIDTFAGFYNVFTDGVTNDASILVLNRGGSSAAAIDQIRLTDGSNNDEIVICSLPGLGIRFLRNSRDIRINQDSTTYDLVIDGDGQPVHIRDDLAIESLSVSSSGNFLTWDENKVIVDAGIGPQDLVAISGDLTNFVQKSGDTMTGDLILSGSSISVGSLSMSTSGNILTWDGTSTLVDSGTNVNSLLSDVVTISGDLGSLSSTVTDLSTDVTNISGSLNDYVLKSGDTMTGPLTINSTLDVQGNAEFDNTVVILGNLTVQGTTTTLNTVDLLVEDNIITLNSTITAGPPSLDSGIEISRGDEPQAQFIWDESSDLWTIGTSGDMCVVLDSCNYSTYVDAAISASLTPVFDDRYVNVSGDTMTGNLTISPLAGNFGYFTQVDGSGTIVANQYLYADSADVIVNPNGDNIDFRIFGQNGIIALFNGSSSFEGIEFYSDTTFSGSASISSLTPSSSGNFLTWNSNSELVDSGYGPQDLIAISGALGSGTFTGLSDTPVNYSGNGGDVLVVNTGETAVEFTPFLSGRETLTDTNQIYTITNGKLTANSNPVCSLVVPTSASALYVQGITDIQAGEFTVVLSAVPEVTGYQLSWMAMNNI